MERSEAYAFDPGGEETGLGLNTVSELNYSTCRNILWIAASRRHHLWQ